MKKTAAPEPITPAHYRAFQQVYDFLNRELFDSTLPHVLVTLQRHANTRGYFAAERFQSRDEEVTAHELAMNPDTFGGRTDREICSTLAHEMAHVWQQTHGTPPRKSYHDKEWAAKMKEIGLQPTSTGEPGGKETGQKVTHYIIRGGAYDRAFDKLEAKGFALKWQSLSWTAAGKTQKANSKVKYTCPECDQNAWAKPGAALVCGVCTDLDEGELVTMVAESQDDNDQQAEAA